MHTSSDMVTSPVEHELNLADLINIDDEPGQELSISLADPVIPPISNDIPPTQNPPATAGEQVADVPQSPISVTGLSPFAARSSHPDFTPRPSFDLNAIWSGTSDAPHPTVQDGTQDAAMEEATAQPERASSLAPVGANDQDFDMFLQGEGEGGDDDGEDMEVSTPQPATPEDIQESFETAPRVWHGKVSLMMNKNTSEQRLTFVTDQYASGLEPLTGSVRFCTSNRW